MQVMDAIKSEILRVIRDELPSAEDPRHQFVSYLWGITPVVRRRIALDQWQVIIRPGKSAGVRWDCRLSTLGDGVAFVKGPHVELPVFKPILKREVEAICAII